MASSNPARCCIVGVKHTGKAQGEERKIENIDCYVTYPEDGSTHTSILFLTDIIGYQLINSRIADQFAANGYFVVMPDLFHGEPVPLNRSESFDLSKWLHGPPGHLPDRVDPVVEAILKEMRGPLNCTRIGGVGYCFGAKYVVRNLVPGGLDVGYICTPSMIEVDELFKIKGPLSIAAAEVDPVFPQDKRHETEVILKEQLEIPYQINLFGGVEHGFGCKADIAVREKRFAKEQAFSQAVNWFDEYLRDRSS